MRLIAASSTDAPGSDKVHARRNGIVHSSSRTRAAVTEVVRDEPDQRGRSSVRLEIQARMDVVDRVVGGHALVGVSEEVGHCVARDGHHDVSGP